MSSLWTLGLVLLITPIANRAAFVNLRSVRNPAAAAANVYELGDSADLYEQGDLTDQYEQGDA